MRVRQLVDLMKAVDEIQLATIHCTNGDDLKTTLVTKARWDRLGDALADLRKAAQNMREVEL